MGYAQIVYLKKKTFPTISKNFLAKSKTLTIHPCFFPGLKVSQVLKTIFTINNDWLFQFMFCRFSHVGSIDLACVSAAKSRHRII